MENEELEEQKETKKNTENQSKINPDFNKYEANKNLSNQKVPSSLKNRQQGLNQAPMQNQQNQQQEEASNDKNDSSKEADEQLSPEALREKARQESKDRARDFLNKQLAGKDPLTQKLVKSQADKLIDKCVDSKSADKIIKQIGTIVNLVDKAVKLKKFITVASATFPIWGWILLAIFAIFTLSAMVFATTEKIGKFLVDYENVRQLTVNMLKLEGFGNNEDVFYKTLENAADDYSNSANHIGELDVALIVSTTNYEMYMDNYSFDEDSVEFSFWDSIFNNPERKEQKFYTRKKEHVGGINENNTLVGKLVSKKPYYVCGDDDFYSNFKRVFQEGFEMGSDVIEGLFQRLKGDIVDIVFFGDTFRREFYELKHQGLAGWSTKTFEEYFAEQTAMINDVENYFSDPSVLGDDYEVYLSEKEAYEKLEIECESQGKSVVTEMHYFNDYDKYREYLISTYIPREYINCSNCKTKKFSDDEKFEIAKKTADEIFQQKETFNRILNEDPTTNSGRGSGIITQAIHKKFGDDGLVVNGETLSNVNDYVAYLIEKDYDDLSNEQKKAISIALRTRLAVETNMFKEEVSDSEYFTASDENKNIANSTNLDIFRENNVIVSNITINKSAYQRDGTYDQIAKEIYSNIEIVDINYRTTTGLLEDFDTGFLMRTERPNEKDYNNSYYYPQNYPNYNSLYNEGECPWYAVSRMHEITNDSKYMVNGNGGDICDNANSELFNKYLNVDDAVQGAYIGWDYSDYGHIAIVEKVYKDKEGKVTKITISEAYNGLGTGFTYNNKAYTKDTSGFSDILFTTTWNTQIGAELRQENCSKTGCFQTTDITREEIKKRWGQQRFDCYAIPK